MKIVKFETFPVSVGYSHAELSARVRRGGVSDVIVKLTTDSGLIGWGESCSGADTRSIEAALQSMAPFVLNQDPWNSESIAHEVFRTGLWEYRAMTGNFAFAGIDMALWDLCGKDCGKPLYRLFGGAMRGSVDYFYYLSRGTPAEIAAQARDGIARGYDCFYLKVGVESRGEEEMLAALRQAAGPEARIRIDANEAWSLPEAVRLLNRWDQMFGIEYAEAPVAASPITLMQELRQRVPVALCANEGLERQSEVTRMIASGAADMLCFSSYWVGSLRRFHSLCHAANIAGIKICKHTHGELGIAAAAGQHMLLTLPNVARGNQQTAAMMTDDLLAAQLPIATGPSWGLIEGPGLGIEIDEAKLARYHEAFRRDGQFLPYAA
ncbi:MAG TPA: mandelate racemase/muconate lactonizing enzyme family protein [Dongiaceae bacterium]